MTDVAIVRKIDEYIEKKQLLTNGQKVIIGLSGGADSMALLHILRQLGYTCIAAHCNFHLRGKESDRDELFVEEYCQENTIEYHKVSFDTYAYMEEKAVSLEMAARNLRYEWFDKLSRQLDISTIAIAHHQDDSVETILINVVRGTGLRGLTGIPPRNEKIVRPLLCLSRAEIMEYLSLHNIPFVTDSTNEQDIYTRNKIRLNVLPLLQEINPSVKETIYNMSQHLSDVKEIYTSYLSEIKQSIFQENVLNIEKLKQYPAAQTILFEILHPYGFNSDTIENIYAGQDSIPGKVFYSEHYRLVKDRNCFILEEIDEANNQEQVFIIQHDTQEMSTPVKLLISRLKKDASFEIEKNKHILYIDEEAITYPLRIRKWKQGDWFTPFGMEGRKKISDYFTDNKFSLPQKKKTWLLCTSHDEIIWIIGERSDNRFRVKNKSLHILKIEIII